jgi:hypothetical protein
VLERGGDSGDRSSSITAQSFNLDESESNLFASIAELQTCNQRLQSQLRTAEARREELAQAAHREE